VETTVSATTMPSNSAPPSTVSASPLAALRCERHLAVVPGATHLFEEPGALETVGDLAGCWFASHLAKGAA
jgi:hypothetical protein